MDDLERLRQDLWERWGRQAERLSQMRRETVETATVVYALQRLFDLKNYTPRRFLPGARRSSQPIPGYDNNVYYLDDHGRPVRMTGRHSYNRLDWRGLYSYAPDQAEYAEWCLQTGVCCQYDRVALQDGQPASFQRLRINSAGSEPKWRGLSPEKLMDSISSDPRSFSVWIEQYELHDGRILAGVAYTEGMGLPAMRSTLSYSYSNGKLDRIVWQWETGEQRTVFAARQPTAFKQLSADLSRRIADRIIELVRDARFEAPLVALELSYNPVESYVPTVIPCTEDHALSRLCLVTAIDPSQWLVMPEDDFAPDITDFHQRVVSTERGEVGARMLQEAARQVTERGPREFRSSQGFVAYAIDWEAEGDQLEKILKACGASRELLKQFRSRRWI